MAKLIVMKMLAFILVAGFTLASNAEDEFGPLKGQVYGNGQKFVVVFLHGDESSGGPANDHEALMRTIAARAKESTAIALLRPGYDNGQGLLSPGANHNRRDQYTKENNDLVAQTLKSIRSQYPDAKLIVAGHSGGAAQLGAVIGRYPGIVDTAILISCPCDIKKWRTKKRRFPRSEKQSPIKFASQVSPDTKVIAITGVLDKNTWPALGKAYASKAKKNGVDATFLEVSGAGHGDRQLVGYFSRIILKEAK